MVGEGRQPKKDNDIKSVIYAAERIDPDVKFTNEACAKLVKIPRVFLKMALTQMVKIAKEEKISVIDEKALELINDKRRKEKKKQTATSFLLFFSAQFSSLALNGKNEIDYKK